jgi:hypothetical protein
MLKCCWLVVIGCLCATTGFGRDLEKGDVEATGQVGVVAGIGTHASYALSAGTAITDHVFLLGEFSYVPLGGGRIQAFGFQAGGSAKLYGFDFGGQYLFPKSGNIAPYAGAGFQILHNSIDFSTSTGGNVSSSGTDAYLSLGGGLRYYPSSRSNRWGLKPELMLFAGPNTYVRIAGGIFYQFR